MKRFLMFTAMGGDFRAERLGNGFIRVEDYGSGSTGLWNDDGTPHCGDLTGHRIGAAITVALAARMAE